MNTKTKSGKTLYLCGGRSFFSKDPNRKLSEVVNCWRRNGHEVRHICGGDIFSKNIDTIDNHSYGSQEVYTRWYRNTLGMGPIITSISEWRDLRHDRQMLKHLQAKCMVWKPDVIWERSCRLHCAGLTLAREIGVPYVLEWKDHLIDYPLSLFRSKALRMEYRKNQGAEYIVVESEVLRNELGRHGVDINKVIVAHNATTADQFSRSQRSRITTRKKLGINDNTILVGYLGSYAFYHDAALLVFASDIIRKNGSAPKMKILMVGAGKEYPACRQLAENLGLLNNILIMKPGVPKNEVPDILAALDIAVLPGSTDIICPIKVQEYMACELPSLIPDYDCNREVIEDGVSGLLFAPKDASALAEKIMALAKNRELREAIGRRAREEVIRRFSWEATWGAALETVLNRSGIRETAPYA